MLLLFLDTAKENNLSWAQQSAHAWRPKKSCLKTHKDQVCLISTDLTCKLRAKEQASHSLFLNVHVCNVLYDIKYVPYSCSTCFKEKLCVFTFLWFSHTQGGHSWCLFLSLCRFRVGTPACVCSAIVCPSSRVDEAAEFLSCSASLQNELTDEHELEQKREFFCPDLFGSCQLWRSEKGLQGKWMRSSGEKVKHQGRGFLNTNK